MKKLFLIILIVFFQLKIYSQKVTWDDINFSPVPIETNPDSTLIVVTNRAFNCNVVAFFGDEKTITDSLFITVVTCTNGKWTAFLQPDIIQSRGYYNSDLNFLYYVHGVGKSFVSNLEACIALKTLYKVNLIAFDYPTYFPKEGAIKTFYNSRTSVHESIQDFETYLQITERVKTEYSQSNHTLLFHSLGGYLYKKFLLEKDDDLVSFKNFDNIVLNAPAVKTARQSKWIEKSTLQKRLYVTSNKNDWVLKGAAFITFSKQLGGNLRKPLAKNATYVNFTSIAGKAHNCFQDAQLIQGNNQIFNFYNCVLNGKEFNINERTSVKPRKDKKGYDLIK